MLSFKFSDQLFPEPPARESQGRGHAIAIAAAVAIATALVLARQVGVGALNTIWAEDGSIFLNDALQKPFLESLFATYAGYLSTFPRLAAEPASWIRLDHAPILLSGTAALATAVLAAVVFEASRGQIRSAPLRLALAASMPLLPAAGLEITNSLSNVHWYLQFTAFWVLFWRPQGKTGLSFGIVILLLAGLSNPFVILLAPIALLRLLVLRAWREQLFVWAFTIGVGLQLIAMWTTPETRSLGLVDQVPDLARWYGFHVLVTSVLGVQLRTELMSVLPLWGVAGISVAALGFVLSSAARLRADELGFFSCCLLANIAFFFVPAALSGISTVRYTVTPILFLFSMTAFTLDRAGPRLTHPAAPRVLAGLLLAATWIADYAPINPRSLGPAWDSQLRSARERCIREPGTPASLVIAPSARLAVSGQRPAPQAWKVDLDCEFL